MKEVTNVQAYHCNFCKTPFGFLGPGVPTKCPLCEIPIVNGYTDL